MIKITKETLPFSRVSCFLDLFKVKSFAVKKRKINKQDLEKFITESVKKIVSENAENVITIYYIKDNKGVSGLFTKPEDADAALSKHDKYLKTTRGFGRIDSKKVLESDYDNGKITIHTIDKYTMPFKELGEIAIAQNPKGNNPTTVPTTKPAPVKTPQREKSPNPLKIPKPGTFPKPNPKAQIKNEGKKIKLSNVIKEIEKISKIESEKNRMVRLMQEAPMNIEPGEHQPHSSIKRGIEGQSETPFSDIELFSKQRLNQSTIEKIGSEEFNAIVRHLGTVGKLNMMEIQNTLGLIVSTERRHKNALENLAKEIVKRKFGLSDEIMQMIDAKLKNPGEIEPPDDNDTPEAEVEQQFTPEELEIIKKHVDKRIVHNTLMMGAGYRAHKVFDELKNALDGIDERLYPVYSKFMPNIEIFMWKMPVEEMFGARQMWGKSEMKCDGDTCKAEAQAIIFPVLLHEVAKAAVEILFLQHLADIQSRYGENVAKEVVKKSDSYYDEHWLKLIGPQLWKYLHDALSYVVEEEGDDYKIIAYVLNKMASMEPEEFMHLMDDAIHNGPAAIEKIKNIVRIVRDEIEAYENENNEIPTPEDLGNEEDHSDEIANLLRQNQDDLLTRTPEEEKVVPPIKSLETMEIDELNNELTAALEDERYEYASKVRDELNRRLNK